MACFSTKHRLRFFSAHFPLQFSSAHFNTLAHTILISAPQVGGILEILLAICKYQDSMLLEPTLADSGVLLGAGLGRNWRSYRCCSLASFSRNWRSYPCCSLASSVTVVHKHRMLGVFGITSIYRHENFLPTRKQH